MNPFLEGISRIFDFGGIIHARRTFQTDDKAALASDWQAVGNDMWQVMGRLMIFETVVYCGSLKVFRILNLSTGTLYSQDFETHEAAEAAIEDGKERADKIVKRVTLEEIRLAIRIAMQR